MKKKVVQNAKEQEQKSELSPEHVEVANKEEAPSADNKEVPQKLIEIPQVDEDTKKLLLKAGFSWDSFVGAFEKINTWAESVDGRFNLIGSALEKMPTNEGIAESLRKKLMESQAQQKTEVAKSAPSGGGVTLKDLLALLGGGGSENPMQAKINELALESLTLGNTFQKVMIAKLAPELADQLLSSAKKTGATQ